VGLRQQGKLIFFHSEFLACGPKIRYEKGNMYRSAEGNRPSEKAKALVIRLAECKR
jgi:hypothetical protein